MARNESGDKAVSRLVDHVAFRSDADGSKDIVSSDHNSADVGLEELLQDACGGGLQFILEYDETNKFEVRFDIVALHLLGLDPAELLHMLRRASNDTVTAMRVVCELLL